MSYAQEQADIGAHMAELDETPAECAYRQYRAEYAALTTDFYQRINNAPAAERDLLRLELSVEHARWVKAHRVPRPPDRPRSTGAPFDDRVVHHGRVIELFADRQR